MGHLDALAVPADIEAWRAGAMMKSSYVRLMGPSLDRALEELREGEVVLFIAEGQLEGQSPALPGVFAPLANGVLVLTSERLLGVEARDDGTQPKLVERPIADLTSFEMTTAVLSSVEMRFGEEEAVARALLPDDADRLVALLAAFSHASWVPPSRAE